MDKQIANLVRTPEPEPLGRSKVRSAKPVACRVCAGKNLTRKITTFPVWLEATSFMSAKEVRVGRVALHECQSCGNQVPTPAGQAKVERCVGQLLAMFASVPPR
jgi:hypothetical protein